MDDIYLILGAIGLASVTLAAAYALLAVVAVLVWRGRGRGERAVQLPPVTVLKPLCGAEPGLYANLRSFCQQDYPEFQIVFGVGDATDPAVAIVERLIREFPHLSLEVVVDPRQHGHNRKISSLINMLARARYDILVMADSDACVRPDYLQSVTAPLLDERVGLVTCLYHDEPTRPIWSRLGAMYINEWYMPSVLLAWLFGHQSYVSGQTLCIRRGTLQAIGGLRGIANHLADDYELGQLVRALGLRIVLSSYMLKAEHHEPTLESLVRHELRWMRTLYVLRPLSFRFIFLTFSVPVALCGLLLTSTQSALLKITWPLFVITVLARLVLHFAHRVHDGRRFAADLWLLPVRDLLLCWVWCRSFFTSKFTWRGSDFGVDADGIMHKLS
ncbi:MAG TPA: bacteriohopanetetrol glucosamine biosynthesis glycosyltransferase HpnI [Steroidobacteraceae bacterium]|nr:bacteriohopanetetrol glucosamine biosynthesis glycosyltransferase HpnI [Steroidobacteraceae bacterium]